MTSDFPISFTLETIEMRKRNNEMREEFDSYVKNGVKNGICLKEFI